MKSKVLIGIALAFMLPAFAVAADTGVQPFLRMPHLHGDRIVFSSEGDLWVGSIQSRTAERLTTHPGEETAAFFSPDGASLAFTADYDGATEVYVMPVTGGAPRRLTYDGHVRTVGWSPDGSLVYYRSSNRNPEVGVDRLWRVPAAGGVPELLPISRVSFASLADDGRRLAFVPVSGEWQHWKRYRGGMADDIWLTDLDTHTYRKLTDFPGVDTSPVWVGDQLYFVSERDGMANLYRYDPASGQVTPATRFTDYDVRYPSSDGRRVVFEHGAGLSLFDPKTSQTEELRFNMNSDRIHARPHRVPAERSLNSVALGPTGRRVLFETRGQLVSVPADSGDTRLIAPDPQSRAQLPAWSPDGKSVAFVSDRSGEEQIWIAPSSGPGEPRQLTRDRQGPLCKIVWSPDGRRLAVSDREARILLVDVATGETTVADQSDRAGSYDYINTSYRFSPDGKWLTFWRVEPTWNQVVYLYNIAQKTKVAVSNPETTSGSPCFDPDGKYLYFLTDRTFNPLYGWANRYYTYDRLTNVSLVPLAADTPSPFLLKAVDEGTPVESKDATADSTKKKEDKNRKADRDKPLPVVKVDTDGIEARVESVPVPADRYVKLEAIEGRLLLMTYEDFPPEGWTPPDAATNQLRFFDLQKKTVTVLKDRLTDFEVSADRRKLLLRSRKEFTVVDATAKEVEKDAVKVPLSGVMVSVEPEAEWRQMFHEAWRIGRDFFYDPNMHGVDWEAVRRKYELLVPGMADRSDLNRIIGEMIGELNAGHAYIGGGDLPGAPRVPMGYLGADFAPAPAGDGAPAAFRVTKIYPGDGFDFSARSPLLTAGVNVKVGDYILAVNGRPVRGDADLQEFLAGTAGQITALTVNNRPSLDKAREVRIRPLAGEDQTRYYDWVEGRRAYLRAHGGENLAYIHIPDMVTGGLREFAKHYYASLDKDGLIFDVRNNGGGSISSLLLLQMSQKPYRWFKPRYGASWTRQDWGYLGPSVALVNEFSGSNAEEFCDGFQALKLGPVIGVRSWGGEVGSGGGYPLLDGGKIFIPNYGEWAPDGRWIVEGKGVDPDQTVENSPDAVAGGSDPQLDAAIAYLKDKLSREPLRRPEPPPFPNKAPRP
jgi:tricorn protease